MKKSYSELDNHYTQTVSSLSLEERMEYLESVIDENQNIISKSGNLLPKLKKLILIETVEAAQKEIKLLQTEQQIKKVRQS